MNIIIHPYEYYVHYQRTYVTSITISQLDENNEETYGVLLVDAFPRSVSMLDLNSSTQNSSHRLNVSFAYRKWWPHHPAIDKINSLGKAKNMATTVAPIVAMMVQQIPAKIVALKRCIGF